MVAVKPVFACWIRVPEFFSTAQGCTCVFYPVQAELIAIAGTIFDATQWPDSKVVLRVQAADVVHGYLCTVLHV
jgi:hypothetical protein